MRTVFARISDIISGKIKSPLDVGVIPNHMGINLCSVEGMSWTKQDDGQLVSLTIHFDPYNPTVLDTAIDDLELTVRSQKGIESLGIKTVGDLVKLTEAELSKGNGLDSKKHINEIKAILASKRLSLKV